LRGLGRFVSNFLSHLWYGVQGWLFNAVSERGITPPSSWTDFRAVFGFVLDVLGISLDHVLELLGRRIGQPAVARIRTMLRVLTGVWEWVSVAIREGPAGIWRMIVERLRDLGNMVLETAVRWVMTRIMAIVGARLAAMAASAGLSAILEAVYAAYQAIQTAIEYARRIIQVLITVFDTVIQIAQGVIDPAAQGVETGLRMIMPVVIGFLANYAGLGGIGQRIREIIDGVRERVDQGILWLIDRALAAGRWLLDRLRAGVAAVVNWWNERRQPRTADGQQHNLYFQRSGETATLMLASEARPVRDHLNDVINGSDFDDATKAQAQDALAFYQSHIDPVVAHPVPASPPPTLQALIDALPNNLTDFSQRLMRIGMGSIGDLPGSAVWRFTDAPKSAHVELLSFRTSRGGTEARSGNPKGWPLITSRGLTSSRGNWVRMHLVTAAVGGRDRDDNLLPTPGAVNTGGTVRGFETQLEQIIYGAANPRERRERASVFRLLNRPTVVWVDVATQGFYPAFTEPITNVQLYDNTTFASAVRMQAGMHYFRNGAWTKDPAPQLDSSTSVPAPNLIGTYQPNFNSIGRDLIVRITGIPEGFAREIIDERGGTPAVRPHNNWAQLMARMFASRRSRNVAITDQFRDAISQIGTATGQGKIKFRD
jgi:hypothetical protein